jgi:hypothetical protein
VHLEALREQFHQRHCCIVLAFGRDVLTDRVGRAFDQHAKDGVRVNIGLTYQTDHLGEDMDRVRAIGGYTLYPTDQLIHGAKRAVWHSASMAGHLGMMQPLISPGSLLPQQIQEICDVVTGRVARTRGTSHLAEFHGFHAVQNGALLLFRVQTDPAWRGFTPGKNDPCGFPGFDFAGQGFVRAGLASVHDRQVFAFR